MSISGSPDDEYDIITLQYTEEGLLTVDDNREGRAAAFGDDIAIECLATEFQREIYVAALLKEVYGRFSHKYLLFLSSVWTELVYTKLPIFSTNFIVSKTSISLKPASLSIFPLKQD